VRQRTIRIADCVGKGFSTAACRVHIGVGTVCVQCQRAERTRDRHTDCPRSGSARAIARGNAHNLQPPVGARNIRRPRPRSGSSAREHVAIRSSLSRRNGVAVGAGDWSVIDDFDDKIGRRIAVAVAIGDHDREIRIRHAQRVVEQRVAVCDGAFAGHCIERERGRQRADRIGEGLRCAGQRVATQRNRLHAIGRCKADRPDFGGDWKRCLAGMRACGLARARTEPGLEDHGRRTAWPGDNDATGGYNYGRTHIVMSLAGAICISERIPESSPPFLTQQTQWRSAADQGVDGSRMKVSTA